MQIKIITISFCPRKHFCTDELSLFISNKTVFSIKHDFFIYQGIPYISFVISYEDGKKETIAKKNLNFEEQKMFETLRLWRNQKAQRESSPPYALFTNNQLVEIVKTQPTTLTALQRINGIGESKIENHGKEVLEILKEKKMKQNEAK